MGPFTTLHRIRYYVHIYSVVRVVCSVCVSYSEACLGISLFVIHAWLLTKSHIVTFDSFKVPDNT
jgi:hypothetical protein